MKKTTQPTQCTGRVRGEFAWQGQIIGEYEFLADHIAAYVECRTEQDGYGSIKDLDEIQAWVGDADLQNATACGVPPGWDSFEILAAEMLGLGIGHCYCPSCRLHYDAIELKSVHSWDTPGWQAISIQCPKEHEVMKTNLLAPVLCQKEEVSVPQRHKEVIPTFLLK